MAAHPAELAALAGRPDHNTIPLAGSVNRLTAHKTAAASISTKMILVAVRIRRLRPVYRLICHRRSLTYQLWQKHHLAQTSLDPATQESQDPKSTGKFSV